MLHARRYAFLRWSAIALLGALAVVFAVIQLASDGLAAVAAAPRTLPTRVPPAFAIAVYSTLDRVAPAPYVETSLAQAALARGDAAAAERFALRLPASPTRDELLARVALGEEIVIAKAGKPVAKLVPIKAPQARRPLGLAKGEFTVPDDFDAPLPPEIEEDFYR